MTSKKTALARITLAFSFVVTAGSVSQALAEGGFSTRSTESGAIFAAAPAPYAAEVVELITVTIAGQGLQYSSTDTAFAMAATIVPGNAVTAATTTVGAYDARVDGPLSITVTSTGFSFTKDTNTLDKSRTEVNAQLIVNGKAYVVADEVAIAVGRATQFGSTAGAGTNATVSVFGNGYSADTVITTKGVR